MSFIWNIYIFFLKKVDHLGWRSKQFIDVEWGKKTSKCSQAFNASLTCSSLLTRNRWCDEIRKKQESHINLIWFEIRSYLDKYFNLQVS